MTTFDAKNYVDQLIVTKHSSAKAPTGRPSLLDGRRVPIRTGSRPRTYAYLAHLDRLETVKFASLHDSGMADEFTTCFLFQGFRFAIDMVWGGDLDLVAAPDVPDETYQRLLAYLRQTPRSLWRSWAFRRHFAQLPQWPQDQSW